MSDWSVHCVVIWNYAQVWHSTIYCILSLQYSILSILSLVYNRVCTSLLFTTSTTNYYRLAISPHTHNGTQLRVAQVSVFEWILVGPKGQGHTYVGTVATNFLLTAFIKRSIIYLVIYCGT